MIKEPEISIGRWPRDDLDQQGYAFFKGSDLSLPQHLKLELSSLRREYGALPADPYCQSGNRYRRHSRFVLLPWLNLLEPRPTSHYLQERELNPVDGGVIRRFERLSSAMETNRLLRELISFDFFNTTFEKAIWSLPVDVGVHAIRYVARPGLPAVSSPNCLHKDGEPFTSVHLIERSRVTGGESLVADNDKRPLARMTLTDCLDTVTVSDKDVYHQVEPIAVPTGEARGYRDVLLIDFTPMEPVTLADEYARGS